ncbi:hypothetical protein PVAND_002159 [Polypedilum vanderplanki]|uniref:Uncharacterized protein n=1 Tax=Polypedilum vanderplanki TaxID=319348 RepID=A0A9J6BRD4_POLVA|nr:hypothetical protein PVAND_002159 [Polypedilum vanderplanki]
MVKFGCEFCYIEDKFSEKTVYTAIVFNKSISYFSEVECGPHIDEKTNNDVTAILFEACEMERFPQNTNEIFPNLTFIGIYKSDLNAIRRDDFEGLKKVTTLVIQKTKIEFLSENTFSKIRQLEILVLQENNIKYIEPGLFEEMKQLKHVDLFKNPNINLCYSILFDNHNIDSLDELRMKIFKKFSCQFNDKENKTNQELESKISELNDEINELKNENSRLMNELNEKLKAEMTPNRKMPNFKKIYKKILQSLRQIWLITVLTLACVLLKNLDIIDHFCIFNRIASCQEFEQNIIYNYSEIRSNLFCHINQLNDKSINNILNDEVSLRIQLPLDEQTPEEVFMNTLFLKLSGYIETPTCEENNNIVILQIKCDFMIITLMPINEEVYNAKVASQNIDDHDGVIYKGYHIDDKTNNDVTGLYYKNCDFIKFPQKVTKTFPSLKFFGIHSSNLSIITKNDLRDLTNLKDIRFYYTQLVFLPKDLFESMKFLEIIVFEGNQLKHIEPKLFAELPNLKHIEFSQNSILNFRYSILNGQKHELELSEFINKLISNLSCSVIVEDIKPKESIKNISEWSFWQIYLFFSHIFHIGVLTFLIKSKSNR